jgi:hypothetical protein
VLTSSEQEGIGVVLRRKCPEPPCLASIRDRHAADRRANETSFPIGGRGNEEMSIPNRDYRRLDVVFKILLVRAAAAFSSGA